LANKKGLPVGKPSIRLAKMCINPIGLPVTVSMMMVIMYEYCHKGAKISGKLKAPKFLSVIFATYLIIF
jgi:hypothetical protein